jgi:hypothetical protein
MSYTEIYEKLFQQITETSVEDNTYVNKLFSKSHGNITYLIFKNLHNNLLYYKADNAKFYEICSYILCFIYSYTYSINEYEIYDRNNSKIQNAIKKLFNDFKKINNNIHNETINLGNIPNIQPIDEVKKESLHHMYMDMIERIELTNTNDIDNRINNIDNRINNIDKDINVEYIKFFRIQIKNQIYKLFQIMKTEYGILESDFNKLQNLDFGLEESIKRNVNDLFNKLHTPGKLNSTLNLESESESELDNYLNNFVKNIFVSNTEQNDLQIREIMQGLDYTNNNTHNLLFNKLNDKLIDELVNINNNTTNTTNTTYTTPYILYLLHILSMYKFYESNKCKMNFVLLTDEIDPMSN